MNSTRPARSASPARTRGPDRLEKTELLVGFGLALAAVLFLLALLPLAVPVGLLALWYRHRHGSRWAPAAITAGSLLGAGALAGLAPLALGHAPEAFVLAFVDVQLAAGCCWIAP